MNPASVVGAVKSVVKGQARQVVGAKLVASAGKAIFKMPPAGSSLSMTKYK